MSVMGDYDIWSLVAGEDLSDLNAGTGKIYKAVAVDSAMVAQSGKAAGGILVYGGKTGEPVSVAYEGVVKYTAGMPVLPGRRLTVTLSGYFTEAVSGSYVVGRNLERAVDSGSVGTGLFNFATAAYMGQLGELA